MSNRIKAIALVEGTEFNINNVPESVYVELSSILSTKWFQSEKSQIVWSNELLKFLTKNYSYNGEAFRACSIVHKTQPPFVSWSKSVKNARSFADNFEDKSTQLIVANIVGIDLAKLATDILKRTKPGHKPVRIPVVQEGALESIVEVEEVTNIEVVENWEVVTFADKITPAGLVDYIDFFVKTHDAGWYMSGGCYDFADRLKELIGSEAKRVTVYGKSKGEDEELELHQLIKFRDKFYDVNGQQDLSDVFAWWTDYTDKRVEIEE